MSILLFYPVKVHLRVGWNTLKDCQAIKYLNVERIARKLLPPDSMAKWRKEKDNWHGIVKELRYFLTQKAERKLTRPHVAYALFEAGGDAKFIDNVIFAGKMRTPKGMSFWNDPFGTSRMIYVTCGHEYATISVQLVCIMY